MNETTPSSGQSEEQEKGEPLTRAQKRALKKEERKKRKLEKHEKQRRLLFPADKKGRHIMPLMNFLRVLLYPIHFLIYHHSMDYMLYLLQQYYLPKTQMILYDSYHH